MRKLEELENWIKSTVKNQTGLANKLGVNPSRVSKWVNQDETMAEEWQDKLREMGYTGPWPKEEAKAPAGDYATRAELAEVRGELKGYLAGSLDKGLDDLVRKIKDLGQRIAEIENRLGKPE